MTLVIAILAVLDLDLSQAGYLEMATKFGHLCRLAGYCSLKAFAEAHNIPADTVYAWRQRGVPRWVLWYLDERRKRLYYEKLINEMKEKICGKEGI